jgi:hypothetical protein
MGRGDDSGVFFTLDLTFHSIVPSPAVIMHTARQPPLLSCRAT